MDTKASVLFDIGKLTLALLTVAVLAAAVLSWLA